MDLWRCGIAHKPLAAVVRDGGFGNAAIDWLPAADRFTFLADPFAVDHDERRIVLAEAYDYRHRLGRIEWLEMRGAEVATRGVALAEPWHLSYPMPIAADGELYLLPEAHRSGGLTLYRAVEFPGRWEVAARVELDVVPVDATPWFDGGRWWLFYSPAGARESDLHIAFADRLTGPWRTLANPVRRDLGSARPGGTPVLVDGRLVLPVQDNRATYGGAIRPLWIDRIDPDGFEAEVGPAITPPGGAGDYRDGMHTLTACGEDTLIDVKRIDRSLAGAVVGAVGRVRRLVRARRSRRR